MTYKCCIGCRVYGIGIEFSLVESRLRLSLSFFFKKNIIFDVLSSCSVRVLTIRNILNVIANVVCVVGVVYLRGERDSVVVAYVPDNCGEFGEFLFAREVVVLGLVVVVF